MYQSCSSVACIVAVATTFAFSIGCTGSVIGPEGGEPGGVGGTSAGGQGGSNAGTAGGSAEACNANDALVPLLGASQRLTTAQFNNSLHALFPALTIEPQTLPTGASKTSLFDNDANAQVAAPVLVEQIHKTAESVSALVAANRDKVLPCKPSSAAEESACGKTFVTSFLEKAYRRPATTDDIDAATSFFESMRKSYGFGAAVGLIVEGVLQSPEFLYLVTPQEKSGVTSLSPFELASRLSYFLWDSPPDEELFQAAQDGSLTDHKVLDQQARRLLADGRAKSAIANFYRQWFLLDLVDRIQKDPNLFPTFVDGTAASLRKSLDRFLAHSMWEADGTVGALLTDPTVYVDPKVAPLVGAPIPPGASWTTFKADTQQRAGLLTQPALLARLGHTNLESPILRGVFVLESLLCAPTGAPPAGVNTTLPEPKRGDPPSTLRARLEETHKGAGCTGCHSLIDGIGFGFQHYDSVGRYRTTENGQPIDATGKLSASDVDGDFNGAIELSNKLAQSKQVQACFAEHFYAYALSRGLDDSDTCALQALSDAFAKNGGDMRQLLIDLVGSPAFRSFRVL